jgi:hypothetical protein
MSLSLLIGPLSTELQYASDACESFVEDIGPLQNLRSQLDRLRHTPNGRRGILEIPRETPLRTIPSTGNYRPNGHGELTVYGTVSCIWDVTVLKVNGKDAISLDGLASTTVRMLDANTNIVVAEWNFDVADAAAPGSHFHMQTPWPLQSAFHDWPNAKSDIDVPRFPILFVLPTDALEFVLGEIFQNAWPKHRARFSNPLQGKRVAQLIQWQLNQLIGSEGSPWLAIKSAKPAATDSLFDTTLAR